jgi:hypothetical protein
VTGGDAQILLLEFAGEGKQTLSPLGDEWIDQDQQHWV